MDKVQIFFYDEEIFYSVDFFSVLFFLQFLPIKSSGEITTVSEFVSKLVFPVRHVEKLIEDVRYVCTCSTIFKIDTSLPRFRVSLD